MVSVYKLWASTEDDREEIDLTGVDVDWEMVFAQRLPLDLVTTDSEQSCDYFSLAGTLGVASARLGKLLSSWAAGLLRSIDVTVNRQPFVLLLPDQPADVLDLELSEYTIFRSNPDRVKQGSVICFSCVTNSGASLGVHDPGELGTTHERYSGRTA